MEASQLTESSVLLSCFFNKSSKDGNKSQVNLTDSTVINHHSCLAILHIKTKRFLFCQYRTSPLSFKFINHSPSWGQTWGKYEPPILNKQFGHNSPLERVFNHRQPQSNSSKSKKQFFKKLLSLNQNRLQSGSQGNLCDSWQDSFTGSEDLTPGRTFSKDQIFNFSNEMTQHHHIARSRGAKQPHFRNPQPSRRISLPGETFQPSTET